MRKDSRVKSEVCRLLCHIVFRNDADKGISLLIYQRTRKRVYKPIEYMTINVLGDFL